MSSCTFFGHRDTPNSIKPILKAAIVDLIENQKVDTFYVGNHGQFDLLAKGVLAELSEIYDIQYSIVLAYIPTKAIENSFLPDGIEEVPQRFRINYRNQWMIENTEFVIGYVIFSFGGAARHFSIAEKKGKKTINLYKN